MLSIDDRSQIPLSTMEMPHAQRFGNLGEIYMATITNYTWIILIIISCTIFFFIQYICVKLYQRFIDHEISEAAQYKAVEFAQMAQSLIHSIVMCMAAIPLFINYGLDVDASVHQEDNLTIIIYKICSVFSTSYFIVATYYDSMILHHSKLIRIGMIFHHFLCIINQSQIFMVTSSGALMSALGIQVELSTVFLCIKSMAKIAYNKRIYYVSGILLMIFYPLTRIVFLPYCFWIVLDSKQLFDEWTGMGAYYLLLSSFAFVIVMSVYFYCLILRNPTKNYKLRNKESRSESKIFDFDENKIEIEVSQGAQI